jgi:hypothetical protein
VRAISVTVCHMTFLRFDVIMSGACSRLVRQQGNPSVLKRAAQQRFVAWLALTAMALLVLMPVLSRSMSADAPMMGMDAGCSMGMDHASHPHGMPGHPDDPTAHCGYCVLLTHTPVVGMGVAVLLAPASLPALSPRSAEQRSAPPAPLLSAHPRGPPRSAIG